MPATLRRGLPSQKEVSTWGVSFSALFTVVGTQRESCWHFTFSGGSSLYDFRGRPYREELQRRGGQFNGPYLKIQIFFGDGEGGCG